MKYYGVICETTNIETNEIKRNFVYLIDFKNQNIKFSSEDLNIIFGIERATTILNYCKKNERYYNFMNWEKSTDDICVMDSFKNNKFKIINLKKKNKYISINQHDLNISLSNLFMHEDNEHFYLNIK